MRSKTHRILLLLLVTLLTFEAAIAGQCNYIHNSQDDYVCRFSSNNEDELSSIDGVHLEGFDDDDVTIVQSDFVDTNNMRVLNGFILDKFRNLRELKLNAFEIEEISIDSFANCVHLEYLSLYGNRLSLIPDRVFANCRNLERLNLNFNNLTRFTNETFRPLSNLRELYLDHNSIQNFSTNFIANNSMIEVLTLSSNLLTNFTFNHQLPLRVIDLSENSISSIRNSRNQNLNALRTFDLSDNVMSFFPNFNMENLENLFMDNNVIVSLHQGSFAWRNLRKIRLRNNRISGINRGFFRNIPNLSELDLTGNSCFSGVINMNDYNGQLQQCHENYDGPQRPPHNDDNFSLGWFIAFMIIRILLIAVVVGLIVYFILEMTIIRKRRAAARNQIVATPVAVVSSAENPPPYEKFENEK